MAQSTGSEKESNWLPAPKEADFSLYIRTDWPKNQALDGSWQPPEIERAKKLARQQRAIAIKTSSAMRGKAGYFMDLRRSERRALQGPTYWLTDIAYKIQYAKFAGRYHGTPAHYHDDEDEDVL